MTRHLNGLAALGLAALTVLAACGGGAANAARVASVAGDGTTTTTAAASGDTNEADAEQVMLDFASCMREHGIDMPDPQFNSSGGGVFTAGKEGADNPVDKTLEFYSRFYLQDDILTKVDRASMMVSLEVRAPFLDNDVVDFARRVPHEYKYRNGTTKYLLKKAMEGVLPADIIYRRKKGFGVPLVRWLKDWREPEAVPRGPGMDLEWVRQRWSEHRAGKADHRLFLWCWIVLQSHMRQAAH